MISIQRLDIGQIQAIIQFNHLCFPVDFWKTEDWEELLAEWADQKKIPKELAEHNYDGSEKDRELDKLIGVRTRSIVRKLKGVTALTQEESRQLLDMPDLSEPEA